MASRKEICSFWNWFSKHSAELAAPTVSESLIEQLEERLFAIARLDWELGPGRKVPNMFALSPRGNRQLLELTRSMVAEAPNLQSWEFHAAKPPRQWDLVFSVIANEHDVEIDGNLWEFVAYKFKNGTYDLVLKPNEGLELSDEELFSAGIIIADGELGEEKRMECIEVLEVVRSWDHRAANSARTLAPGLLADVFEGH